MVLKAQSLWAELVKLEAHVKLMLGQVCVELRLWLNYLTELLPVPSLFIKQKFSFSLCLPYNHGATDQESWDKMGQVGVSFRHIDKNIFWRSCFGSRYQPRSIVSIRGFVLVMQLVKVLLDWYIINYSVLQYIQLKFFVVTIVDDKFELLVSRINKTCFKQF